MKLRSSFLGMVMNASFSKNQRFLLIFFLLLPLLFTSNNECFAQSSDTTSYQRTTLLAGEFNGHFYTPPADWILQKMNTPSQSLIGDPPCSTINVTYIGFTPEAEAAFQHAVDIWETVLSSTVDITIEATWEVMSSDVLGSTGTAFEINFTGAPTSDNYAASLANQIAGTDISPGDFDMTMNFNSIFDWYLGTDGNPAFDEYDFVTVVLHEIGHGLGFSSAKDMILDIGIFLVNGTFVPTNYDHFLTLGPFGTHLTDLNGTILGEAFMSNNVYNNSPLAVAANGGIAPKMYAPETFAPGSTLSHWDEDTYPPGNPQSLMTPIANPGEAIHNPGEMTIGLLEDLGWTICYLPIPTNDLQCNAIAMECGQTVVGLTTYATNSGVGGPLCTDGSYEDVFYSFTALPGYSYSVTVNGDDYDGVLILYTGTCDELVEYACMDEGLSSGIAETIDFSISSESDAAQYFIRTYDYFSGGGSFELSISCTSPNDDPCDAPFIECNSSVVGNTGEATSSGIGAFSCSTPTIQDVFYKWDAEPNFDYTITVNGDNYDGVLALYTGSCGSLTEIDCADNGFSPGEEETLTFSSGFSQTMYIRTSDWSSSGGDFVLSLQCTSSNQNPCESIPLACGETVGGSTYGGSMSGLSAPTCASGSLVDAFYQFDAYPGTEYQVLVNGDDYDGVLIAYSGSCAGTLTEIACADEGTQDGIQEEMIFSVETAAIITIRTYDWFSGQGSFNITLNCTGLFDCPLLSADIGDACDDGNPETSFDMVNDLCECAGNLPCQNEIEFATASFDGTDVIVPIATCVYEQEYNILENANTGSNYTFTSTGGGGYMTVRSGTYDGTVLGSGYSPLSIVSDIDGSLFVHYTINEFCETTTGCVIATAQCTTCPHYCPVLDLAVGEPCDDGNTETSFDMVNDLCECAGNLPCQNEIEFLTDYLDGTDAIIPISACVFEQEYNIVHNATAGSSYTFTSTGGGGYMTIRSGTYDGNVLGSGYSPLTVVSDIDGTLFVHYTLNEICETTSGICITATVQCSSCVFDCPDLSLYIGDSCDDGNPDTANDTVTAQCNCQGTYPTPPNDLCANAEVLPVNEPGECPDNEVIGTTLGANDDFGAFSCDSPGEWPDVFYSFNSGDFNHVNIDLTNITQTDMVVGVGEICGGDEVFCFLGTGVHGVVVEPNTDYYVRIAANILFGFQGEFTICLSGQYDCPPLSANIGDACNDGNADTENDTVTAECSCIGSIVYDCPVLAANIGDSCNDENADTENDTVTPECNCIGTIIYDCPILSADIGDACNDGDSNTIDDTVTPDCDCVGIAVPANDLCDNAETLTVYEPGECPDNQTIGTTIGASDDIGAFSCDPSGGPWPDVFYSFNSGNFTVINIQSVSITQGDMVIELLSTCSGESVFCNLNVFSNSIPVETNTDYIIRIAPNLFWGGPGTFSICLSGVYDCPLLAANIGDACNDGNADTENDTVTPDCDCIGSIVYDCPLLSADIGDACNDANPNTENDTVTPECDCVGNISFDCPLLAANFGDSCDDGNSNTIDDTITFDCDCVGIAVPANDLCDNAETLTVYEPGECPDNQTIGTTIGASDDIGAFSCDPSGGPWPDVFYSFNSGNFTVINIQSVSITQGDMVIELLSTCSGESVFCNLNVFSNSIPVETNTDYIIRIAPNLFWGGPGTFSICLSGVYDCPLLAANIGDACNDGNADTENDTVTPDCDCIGSIVYDCPLLSADIGDSCNDGNSDTENDMVNASCNCIGSIIYDCPALSLNIGDTCDDGDAGTENDTVTPDCDCVGSVIYDCPALSLNIGDACDDGDSGTENDMITADCNCEGSIIYDCPLLTADIGDDCNDGNADTENDTVTSDCDCIGTIIYDCPLLSANIGDACNDGNPGTENDMVNASCNCIGSIIYDCPALSLNIGDTCNDGNPGTENDIVTSDCDCIGTVIYDCPLLSADIGDDCNDGNADTENDTVTSDCDCIGTIIYDCPLLSADIGDDCDDGDSGTENDMITADCNCEGSIIYDCPLLSADIGDDCNDGDSNTENDTVTPDCDCVGTVIYNCPILSANIGDDCDDGNPNTINDTVTPACTCIGEPTSASLNGTGSWNSACGPRDMTVAFYQPGTDLLVELFTSSIAANGTYSVGSIPVGTFDIYVKIAGNLQKVYPNQVMTDGPNNLVLGAMTPGDLNGDNGVNIVDVSVVNGAFGSINGASNYNPLADMNCDGGVNIVDVSILNGSFGLIGAQP